MCVEVRGWYHLFSLDHSSPSFLRQSLSLNSELEDLARLVGQWTPRSCLFPTTLKHWGINVCNPNSGPHVCTAGTLPTEPSSPWLPCLVCVHCSCSVAFYMKSLFCLNAHIVWKDLDVLTSSIYGWLMPVLCDWFGNIHVGFNQSTVDIFRHLWWNLI